MRKLLHNSFIKLKLLIDFPMYASKP